MTDESTDDERRRRGSPPPVEFVRSDEEQAPLPPRDQPAAWVPRPEDFGPPPQQPFPQAWPQAAPKPKRAILGGISLILSGLLGMASTFIILTQPLTPADIAVIENMTAEDLALNALLIFLVVYAQAF